MVRFMIKIKDELNSTIWNNKSGIQESNSIIKMQNGGLEMINYMSGLFSGNFSIM